MAGLVSRELNRLTKVVVVSTVCVVKVVEVTVAGVVMAVVEMVTVAGNTVHCANDEHASSLWLWRPWKVPVTARAQLSYDSQYFMTSLIHYALMTYGIAGSSLSDTIAIDSNPGIDIACCLCNEKEGHERNGSERKLHVERMYEAK